MNKISKKTRDEGSDIWNGGDIIYDRLDEYVHFTLNKEYKPKKFNLNDEDNYFNYAFNRTQIDEKYHNKVRNGAAYIFDESIVQELEEDKRKAFLNY